MKNWLLVDILVKESWMLKFSIMFRRKMLDYFMEMASVHRRFYLIVWNKNLQSPAANKYDSKWSAHPVPLWQESSDESVLNDMSIGVSVRATKFAPDSYCGPKSGQSASRYVAKVE